MSTNQTDIERIKQSFRECAELAVLHRNRKGGEDTPVSLSPYDVIAVLDDHDLKSEQLRAAQVLVDALAEVAREAAKWQRGEICSLGSVLNALYQSPHAEWLKQR